MAQDSLHELLMRAQTLMHRRVTAGASELGLTPGQPKVLEFLARHGEADQATIAAGCLIERATIGALLERMEAQGLISRARHEGNKRSIYVTLTAAGEQAVAELGPAFARAEQPVVNALTPAELQELERLLAAACDALETAKPLKGKE